MSAAMPRCTPRSGRYADVVLVENFDDFSAGTVISRGDVAAEELVPAELGCN